MVLCQTVHDSMPVFLYLTSCLRYQQKRKCIHLCFPTDSAPYGESHWALLPAGSPSSVPIQPSSAYGGLFSQSAVDGIHWKGCTWRGWHPYQLPNNIIWPSECTGTSLTLRPFGLSGYSLCYGYQAQLVCGQTSLWLLESIILFGWSLPKAFDLGAGQNTIRLIKIYASPLNCLLPSFSEAFEFMQRLHLPIRSWVWPFSKRELVLNSDTI